MSFPSPSDPVTWALVGALAFARGMDFLSTWLVTPGLALEANPLMRRLRWGRMGLVNLALLGLPLLHHGLAITFIVTSLLVAGSNLANGALARGMGEERHLEAQRQALRRVGLAGALAMNSAGALLVGLAGGFILVLAPPEGPAWWAGLGVAMYGAADFVHLNWGLIRLHRSARRPPRAPPPGPAAKPPQPVSQGRPPSGARPGAAPTSGPTPPRGRRPAR
jgi:hypothetical protein